MTDQTEKASLERDQSFGRFPNGSSNFVIMDLPTPNRGNFESNSIIPNVSSGFYSDSFLLTLNTSIKGDIIHYTLDGSDPTKNDSVYISPILIKDRSDEPNIFSDIPTAPPDTFNRSYYYWKQPGKVAKATTLKFRSFRAGVPSSKIHHQTYFVGEKFKDYTFPVFSLMIDSSSLFDYDTGLYVPGHFFDSLGFSHWPIGNYHGEGDAWERNGHIQFFETDKKLEFSTGVGLKMHGNGSLGMPQKNLRLLFRKKYGLGKLNYPIFESQQPASFQRLLLRTGGNTFTEVNFLEAILQDIVKNEDLDIQQNRPSVLFINGEYWGVHNIREKMDEHYFESYYDINEDQILTRFPCSQNDIGGGTEFRDVFDFVENNSLKIDTNYQLAKQLLDVENIMTYYIMQIFYANKDMHSNFRYWGTKGNQTKWRTMVYDLDISFGFGWGDKNPSIEHFQFATRPICHTLIFRKLLENQEFKEQFITRSEELLKTTFHSDTIINRFESFKKIYRPHMQEHIDRWGYPESIESWDDRIEEFKRFARQRPCYFKEHLEDFFEIDSLNFNCNDTLTVLTNSEEIIENEEIRLYPNPASKSITLESTKLKNSKLNIFNTLGQQVLYRRFDDHQSIKRIEISALKTGIYYIILLDENGAIRWREKLIVEY